MPYETKGNNNAQAVSRENKQERVSLQTLLVLSLVRHPLYLTPFSKVRAYQRMYCVDLEYLYGYNCQT
jgi:hypothetical protein